MRQPIYIAASPWFIGVASVCYGCAFVAVMLANIPWWLQGSICSLLVLDYRRVTLLYGLVRHRQSLVMLQHDCDYLRYQLRSGRQYKGRILKQGSFCSSLILIIYIQHLYGRRYLVIPRDSISEHSFRYLAFKIYANRDIIKARSN